MAAEREKKNYANWVCGKTSTLRTRTSLSQSTFECQKILCRIQTQHDDSPGRAGRKAEEQPSRE